MKLRLPVAALAVLVAGAVLAPTALAVSTTVVISQVAFRGPTGGNDELIQLHNVSATAQDIGGWQLWGTSATGSSQNSRATIPAGTSLPAGKSYLLTNVQPGGTTASGGSYSGSVPGDLAFTSGVNDMGGVQLRNAAGTVIDAVGATALSGTGLAYREGAGLNFPLPNGNDAFLRKASPDTDENAADFTGPQAMDPQNCGAACAVAGDPCPSTGVVKISAVQTLGENSPCDTKTVTVRGIVTGVDDLYGSSYDAIYKADSGLWLQEATHDPAATTSEGIFIAGVKRGAVSASGVPLVIGDEITITGRIGTQFGLVELVPPGVGSVSNPDAPQVDLASVATINSTGNALPAPIDIDPVKAAAQDPIDRPYYRSLQGMRVRLPEGIATGGGTTKFNEVFLRPGTTAERLFRKNTPAAASTPWSDAPDEIGVAPDGGAHNPADPRLPWHSDTQIDLDLFDITRNVVGPLTFSFDFYEVMPQLGGPTPTIQRGPINAAYPPAAPAQPPSTLRFSSFNVENYFPAGEINDGHLITDQEYADRTKAIVAAVRGFLREPDVIAVQEVAVFANGHNALTGLAQALGNYTPYNAVNNDARGIAPGFLIKNGVTASKPQLLDKDAQFTAAEKSQCDLAPGSVYDRAPFALDVSKGDLAATVVSNHFASQSHEDYCRVREADLLRAQVEGMEAAGKNVIVAGDLNDFEFSNPLTHLTQSGALTNLWNKAPANQAYSYKFDGHLQTLDHVLVSPGLVSRVSDMRYVHLDNDYYARPLSAAGEPDGTGISDHDPPLATFTLATGTSVDGTVTGTVPATLSLILGSPASLGAFTPGLTSDYTGSMTANVTSTGGDAQLSVIDASSTATGRLVNGAFALAQPLQVNAGGPFAPLRSDNGPLPLKSYAGPVSNDAATLAFKQHIDASEALRTGSYSKTLTFTLTTTTP